MIVNNFVKGYRFVVIQQHASLMGAIIVVLAARGDGIAYNLPSLFLFVNQCAHIILTYIRASLLKLILRSLKCRRIPTRSHPVLLWALIEAIRINYVVCQNLEGQLGVCAHFKGGGFTVFINYDHGVHVIQFLLCCIVLLIFINISYVVIRYLKRLSFWLGDDFMYQQVFYITLPADFCSARTR